MPITTATYEDIQKTTLAAHEIAALFEAVSEKLGVEDDQIEDETHENEEGEQINAYASPLELWATKTGRITVKTQGKRSLWSHIKWGIIQSVADAENWTIVRPEGIHTHETLPFLSSRFDMKKIESDGTWNPVIAKNVPGHMANFWRNAIGHWTVPENVLLEAQHHMAVTNTSQCHVIGFFSGTNTRHFVVERDDDLIADIEATANAFWDCIREDRQPQRQSQRDARVIAQLNAKILETPQIADWRRDNEAQALIGEEEKLKAEVKKATKRLDEIKAILFEKMDGVDAAIVADDRKIVWVRTPETQVSYTRKAGAHIRTLKIKKESAGPALLEETDGKA